MPADVREDYEESALILAHSPKASAALSRRCLQHVLRDYVRTKSRDLNDQINEVIAAQTLPSELAHSLDVVRTLGNFAAHPGKSKSTGEIVDVEPQEAEWTLEVLDELFEHVFVRPARIKARNDALNEKLKDAGKQPLKGS